MTVAAIIVAAGRGTRLGAELPKQYLPVRGVPSVRRSVEAFLREEFVSHVLTVIHPDDGDLYRNAMRGLVDPRLVAPVPGGNSRAESVRLGLDSLEAIAPDLVLIHDAARPFVTSDIIERVVLGLEGADGTCAALPQVDAMWRVADGFAEEPVSREGLWRAQTPQGFHYAKILEAHRQFEGDATDDVAVARAAGMSVRMVLGSEANYKITTAEDLARANRESAD